METGAYPLASIEATKTSTPKPYSYNGQIVISYRGTDSAWDVPAWMTGGGDYRTDQAVLAAQFYRSIATAACQ